ncbi:MAG: ATP-binding cassette domain-containing protein [Prevotella sp.]
MKLELKDIPFETISSASSFSLSFTVEEQELVSIYTTNASEMGCLFDYILGFKAYKSGYISIDGAVVDTQSAAYFRQNLAFVPTHFSDYREGVIDLFQLHLKANDNKEAHCKEQLKYLLKEIGIDKEILKQKYCSLTPFEQQVILLCFSIISPKDLVLIDHLWCDEESEEQTILQYLLNKIREQGSGILAVTSNETIANSGTKRINL